MILQSPTIYDPSVVIGDKNKLELGTGSRVDSFCKIEIGEGCSIGQYTHIASFVHLGIGSGRLTIGDHVGIASGAKIITGSNTLEGVSCSAASPEDMQVIEKRHTIIGNYAVVYAGAIILPGIEIGERACVGAGAVVTHDVPDDAIVKGTPARLTGWRNVRQ